MKKILVWIDFVLCPLVVVLALQFGTRDALWVAGLSFSLAAAVLWFLARRKLGKSFSVDPEARQLVTHGLYGADDQDGLMIYSVINVCRQAIS